MKLLRMSSALTLIGVLAVAACGGDDGGPGGSLSQQQKTALAQALTDADALGGLGAFAGSVVELIGETGKINAAASAAVGRAINESVSLALSGIAGTSYDAVGFAISFSFDLQGEAFSGWFLGVVGWNFTGNTVSELVFVGGGDEGTTLPTSASGTIQSGDVFAVYWNGTQGFYGTSGTAAVNSSNFGGSSTNCSQSGQGFTYTCSYTKGRMSGDFAFTATGETSGTYTQPAVNFSNVPALRMTISVTD